MWLHMFFFIFLTFCVLLSCQISVLVEETQGPIVYSRDHLTSLWQCSMAGEKPEVPKKLRRKYQGCRAGRRWWLRKRRYRPYLPFIVMRWECVSWLHSYVLHRDMAAWQHTGYCLDIIQVPVGVSRQELQQERQEERRGSHYLSE